MSFATIRAQAIADALKAAAAHSPAGVVSVEKATEIRTATRIAFGLDLEAQREDVYQRAKEMADHVVAKKISDPDAVARVIRSWAEEIRSGAPPSDE